jgi:uncharacterized protein YjbJ (UPF0337 family)
MNDDRVIGTAKNIGGKAQEVFGAMQGLPGPAYIGA